MFSGKFDQEYDMTSPIPGVPQTETRKIKFVSYLSSSGPVLVGEIIPTHRNYKSSLLMVPEGYAMSDPQLETELWNAINQAGYNPIESDVFRQMFPQRQCTVSCEEWIKMRRQRNEGRHGIDNHSDEEKPSPDPDMAYPRLHTPLGLRFMSRVKKEGVDYWDAEILYDDSVVGRHLIPPDGFITTPDSHGLPKSTTDGVSRYDYSPHSEHSLHFQSNPGPKDGQDNVTVVCVSKVGHRNLDPRLKLLNISALVRRDYPDEYSRMGAYRLIKRL